MQNVVFCVFEIEVAKS